LNTTAPFGDRRDQKHTRGDPVTPECVHDSDSVHTGHLIVHHGHIRELAADQLNRLSSTPGLRDHLNPRIERQSARDPVTEERVIIHHHNNSDPLLRQATDPVVGTSGS
jgi:hypothetical protein